MITIRLDNGAWRFDEARKLGADGGFGEVFAGEGSEGAVAVKRLKLSASEAAFRELSIGAALAGRTLEHVVPVLDHGLDPDLERYFLVMPLCKGSLQEHLAKGAMNDADAVSVALQIVKGLREVGDLVHRDLKPGNVLNHEGVWKIADFGIAKFVEDSTSLQTLRDCLTPQYGAPEQWRNERSTKATDVYALGCLIHAMLKGKPPFTGSLEDIRHAHLETPAPTLAEGEPKLKAMVAQMLRKAPEARPTLERCQAVLEGLGERVKATGGRAVLQAVAADIAQAEAKAEAELSLARSRAQARQTLGQEAVADLERIFQDLIAEIRKDSDNLRQGHRQLYLGSGQMKLGDAEVVSLSGRADVSLPHSGWDVAAASSISVTCQNKYNGRSYMWSCSLIFSRPNDGSEYRWREIGFWSFNGGDTDAPHGLNARGQDLDVALSSTIGMEQLAVGPWTIDGEDEGEFIDRWIWIFAKAASGALDRPRSLPVNAGFWR